MASDLITSFPIAEAQTATAAGAPGSSGPPKVFYLAYADGKAMARSNPNPCHGTPPKFVCDFAPTLDECQRQIQSYLDRWYAEMNIVFTLTRPTSGSYYTEVVSSGGGAWCDAASNVAGIAPFLCDDLAGGVAYTFLGGNTAKETAVIIAQEQAHLVGLEHTLSTRDIMDPTICPNCDGFENVDNKIQSDHCDRTQQNSYQMMKDRLGTWTGGIKPTPFGCTPDLAPPEVDILAPSNNAVVAANFVLRVQASDQCKVSRVTVAVAPMGLHAESTAAPFEWTLTHISGVQTITVTAFDASGKQSSSSITVRAGGSGAGSGGTDAGADRTAGDAGRPGTADGGAVDGGTSSSDASTASVSQPGEGGCQLGGCGVAAIGTDAGSITWWSSVVACLAIMGLALATRSRRPALAKTRARVLGRRLHRPR